MHSETRGSKVPEARGCSIGQPDRTASTVWCGRRQATPAAERKRDQMPWSPGFAGFVRLLNVDGFAVGIKRALDANFLAFILLQGFLVVDIISLTAGVLQNVLVS